MKGSSLVLDLRPSRHQALATVGVHLAAGAGVLLADLPVLWRAVLLVAVAAGYAVTGRMGRKGALHCGADGRLAERVGDEWLDAELSLKTLVWPRLVVLRYRPAASKRPVVRIIFPDSLGEDDFRRLRVWLRWRSQPPR